MALNRTNNSQYYKLDSSTLTDKQINTAQSGGIGVGAKIKALNTADPANGVTAYVVDAFDIDWGGYKLGDKSIKQTGDLIEAIEEGVGTDLTDYPTKTEVTTEISNKVGNLSSLSTTEKGTIVGAINELKTTGGKTYQADTNNNTITVGTIQYTLDVNNTTNKISISAYTPLSLSLTGNKVYEIGDTTKSRTVTASVSGTNSSNCSVTWSNNTSANSKTCTQSFASPTENTLTCTVSDGKSTDSKSTKVSFEPRVMWCYSTNDNLASIDNTSLTGYAYSVQAGYKIDNKSLTLTEPAYVYFACVGSPSKFYINKGTSKATLSGGFTKTDYTFTKYSNKTYNLYRTTNKQAAGTYRIDVE